MSLADDMRQAATTLDAANHRCHYPQSSRWNGEELRSIANDVEDEDRADAAREAQIIALTTELFNALYKPGDPTRDYRAIAINLIKQGWRRGEPE